MRYAMVERLKGKTLTNIDVDTGKGTITFTTDTGRRYVMKHNQDCCETVYIEDINGDLDDLIDVPIDVAEERTSNYPHPEAQLTDLLKSNTDSRYRDECNQWTFYEFRTIKGSVSIRWYGSSNGYYSVDVDLMRID